MVGESEQAGAAVEGEVMEVKEAERDRGGATPASSEGSARGGTAAGVAGVAGVERE